MFDIQKATLAARKRLGRDDIATRIERGRGQIVLVDKARKGAWGVTEVSAWMPAASLAAALHSLEIAQ